MSQSHEIKRWDYRRGIVFWRREELLLLWALVFLSFDIFYMQNNLYKTLKAVKNKSSLRKVHVHVEINVYNNICQLNNSYYDHISYSKST